MGRRRRPRVTVEWTSARTFGVAPQGPGNVSWQRSFSPTSWTRQPPSSVSATQRGATSWWPTTDSQRDELNAFREEVTTTGDGFLAVFDGATRAVRCGAAMARSAESIGLAIRVGIHTGEVEFIGSDARGVAVHAAARVMSFAGPGEVFISSTTKDLLDGSGMAFEDAGAHVLKGLAGKRRLFRLSARRRFMTTDVTLATEDR